MSEPNAAAAGSDPSASARPTSAINSTGRLRQPSHHAPTGSPSTRNAAVSSTASIETWNGEAPS
ncbi:hypothetical protein R4I43_19045 [Saccharopolyspora sp. S2-29]|uniref:Uncharacterized protein n=1 Tax=Saccharopolyspora mangrovi TaxID=3082379 RepID=A0ABU6ADH0_9PSEU|nr:hypothetical protein [Saccharopolyspora sp. S2-29]MEB3369513.1 hypothetical protein [Saccharopolyspora sp. S2-29]